jgi:hydroxymethylbilane synthase
MKEKLVLGTRGSDLARIQAQIVETAVRKRWPGISIETRTITTHGDAPTAAMAQVDSRAGRKGTFTAEIERALLEGTIDFAVHSAKDLPSDLTAGTSIAAVLARAAVSDTLVSSGDYTLAQLPHGAVVATGSVRRKHQLCWQRPDLEIVELAGNVPTRLRKLSQNNWHAIVLAQAGLERLGIRPDESPVEFESMHLFMRLLPVEVFLSAGGQGTIAVQVRQGDRRTEALLEPISDAATWLCLRAEREFLRLLQADCNQPVSVLAIIEGTTMKLQAQLFVPGAIAPRTAQHVGHFENAHDLAAVLFTKIHDG